jgi:hypothetical protein
VLVIILEEIHESEHIPLSGDLSSNMRPKCISRIELGDVGRGSHSVSRQLVMVCMRWSKIVAVAVAVGTKNCLSRQYSRRNSSISCSEQREIPHPCAIIPSMFRQWELQ